MRKSLPQQKEKSIMRTKGTFKPSTSCNVCGKELTSPQSIERHRGEKCHATWMEKRVAELETQTVLLRAAVDALNRRLST